MWLGCPVCIVLSLLIIKTSQKAPALDHVHLTVPLLKLHSGWTPCQVYIDDTLAQFMAAKPLSLLASTLQHETTQPYTL